MANSRLCSIPDCNKPVSRRDWCNAHYHRWRAHGDPLAGRTPEGEPERYYREVVLSYDGDDCLPWPYSNNGEGYGQIKRDGRYQLVSRLVCEEEHGPPPTPGHEAAHSCGHGSDLCCTKRHLSWKTPIQNAADKVVHGTHVRGERQWMAKLKEPEVRQIMALKGVLFQREIADQFGVSRRNVSDIHAGKTWAHLFPMPSRRSLFKEIPA